MKLSIALIILSGLTLIAPGFGQIGSSSDVPRVTEFSIPVSPAFDLLGVNNAEVARPGNIRDFKVDWAFKSWRLKPNIALQAQPVWEICYNKAKLEKYRRASPFSRTLSTLDISAGTIEDESQARRLSFAVKMTIYKGNDVLLDAGLFKESDKQYDLQRSDLEDSLLVLKQKLRKTNSEKRKDALREQIESKEAEMDMLDVQHKRDNLEIASAYAKRNWNASFIDVAYGKVFSYKNDTLSKLDLKGSGHAFWVNGSYGIGKKILLSAMFRTTMIDKEESNQKSILYSGGINFRYGSPKFNFFAEIVYTQTEDNFTFEDESQNILSVNTLSTSYGGDWRLSRNVVLTYGVRVDYDRKYSFQRISPVAGIACMMR